ncbi:MAG TPA: response regulator [Nitrospirota bacterium]|nr:response regulator [Nitrospirota bacterium]
MTPTSANTPQSAIRNQKSVLIIDDSEDDILLTRLVLSRLDRKIAVDAVPSGEQGLAFLRRAQELPTLVLLDLKMAGMDGVDVLNEIRSDVRLRPLPVVIVTHSDLESDKKISRENGADGFLNKCVDLEQFMMNLRDQLGRWLND